MKEQLITFDTAKLANKKGFFEWTKFRYNKKGTFNESKSWNISAPTQSLLQKWLREKHNIRVLSTYHINSDRSVRWYWITIEERWYKSPTHSTYEEALEKGLQEALKLIKLS